MPDQPNCRDNVDVPDDGEELDPVDRLDSAGADLDQARARIEVVRDDLLAVNGRAGDVAKIDQLVSRLDGLIKELRRTEEAVSGHTMGVDGVG